MKWFLPKENFDIFLFLTKLNFYFALALFLVKSIGSVFKIAHYFYDIFAIRFFYAVKFPWNFQPILPYSGMRNFIILNDIFSLRKLLLHKLLKSLKICIKMSSSNFCRHPFKFFYGFNVFINVNIFFYYVFQANFSSGWSNLIP